MSLIKSIQKLNELYNTFKRSYDILKKIVKNHSTIKQKIILSEQILNQAYMLIKDELETTEQRREFNKIIKNIKNEKNK
jgi:ABC-type Na+ transport system ATPase subunit NatA